jgi:hypothetical protein
LKGQGFPAWRLQNKNKISLILAVLMMLNACSYHTRNVRVAQTLKKGKVVEGHTQEIKENASNDDEIGFNYQIPLVYKKNVNINSQTMRNKVEGQEEISCKTDIKNRILKVCL